MVAIQNIQDLVFIWLRRRAYESHASFPGPPHEHWGQRSKFVGRLDEVINTDNLGAKISLKTKCSVDK